MQGGGPPKRKHGSVVGSDRPLLADLVRKVSEFAARSDSTLLTTEQRMT